MIKLIEYIERFVQWFIEMDLVDFIVFMFYAICFGFVMMVLIWLQDLLF